MANRSRKMQSVAQHAFSQIPNIRVPRSTFDRSFGIKTTLNSGWLIPFFVQEGLPGDTMNVQFEGFARMATPLHPTMDNLHIETFFFEIPIRLVHDNWRRLMGEQANPGDSIDYLTPIINSDATGYDNESIFDYMGLPTNIVASYEHRADFLRSYNLVYSQWFKPQDLVNDPPLNTGDGPDDHTDYTLLKRAKRHDYFTSCLPWPQKFGETAIPLGEQAPVVGIGKTDQVYNVPGASLHETGASAPRVYANSTNVSAAGDVRIEEDPLNPGFPGIYADLASATAASINDWRLAFQIQRIKEKDARSGTRYNEMVLGHFGVDMPDAKWRSVYLGGGSNPVNIVPLPQTVDDETGAERGPLGKLGGVATADIRRNGFVKSMDEHVIVLGLINIRADLTYQKSLHRMWSRRSRYDFYFPSLAHIGEQAVLSKELYLDGTAADEDVFGYQEAWADHRYAPSMITGKFRSNDPQSLDTWHLSQDFENRPVLNSEFILEDVPMDRILAVTDESEFILDGYFKFKHTRALPVYSVPGLIDHF